MNILSQTVPIQFDTVFSPYAAADWRAAFEDVALLGLTGVELAVAYPERVDAALVRSAAQNYGLAITTLSTGQIYGLAGLYLTAPDAQARAKAAGILRGHIDLSAKLGLPHVTVGLVRGKLEPGGEALLEERLADALFPLLAYAREQGVKLQIEAINRGETSFLNSAAKTLSFIDKLNAGETLGLLYDTYHSHLEDADMADAVRAAAGKITNVHFADSHRGLPGEGTIDFAPVMRALEETGYRGALTLETLCVPTREHVLAHYAGAIKNLLYIGGNV